MLLTCGKLDICPLILTDYLRSNEHRTPKGVPISLSFVVYKHATPNGVKTIPSSKHKALH